VVVCKKLDMTQTSIESKTLPLKGGVMEVTEVKGAGCQIPGFSIIKGYYVFYSDQDGLDR